MQKAIEKQTKGYTIVYNLYVPLAKLLHTDPEKDVGSVYAAFDDLRNEMKRFGTHVVVLYLDMSEKRKKDTLKLVSMTSFCISRPR